MTYLLCKCFSCGFLFKVQEVEDFEAEELICPSCGSDTIVNYGEDETSDKQKLKPWYAE